MTAGLQPVALHTAPSGKVTKWGVAGYDEYVSFPTKKAAQAFIEEQVKTHTPPAPREESDEDREFRAERRGTAIAAPRPTPEYTEADELSDLLPEGAVTESPASGRYIKVKVAGKNIAYVRARRDGLLVEFLTTRLVGTTRLLLEGTKVHQNQTALRVSDEATREQARVLFAYAARSVQS